LGAATELDDRVGRHLETGDLLPDAMQSGLDPAALGPKLGEGSVQEVHPPPPLFPLLDVEQDGLRVDHPPTEQSGPRIKVSLEAGARVPRCRGERLKAARG
jgi:hypothetical protein